MFVSRSSAFASLPGTLEPFFGAGSQGLGRGLGRIGLSGTLSAVVVNPNDTSNPTLMPGQMAGIQLNGTPGSVVTISGTGSISFDGTYPLGSSGAFYVNGAVPWAWTLAPVNALIKSSDGQSVTLPIIVIGQPNTGVTATPASTPIVVSQPAIPPATLSVPGMGQAELQARQYCSGVAACLAPYGLTPDPTKDAAALQAGQNIAYQVAQYQAGMQAAQVQDAQAQAAWYPTLNIVSPAAPTGTTYANPAWQPTGSVPVVGGGSIPVAQLIAQQALATPTVSPAWALPAATPVSVAPVQSSPNAPATSQIISSGAGTNLVAASASPTAGTGPAATSTSTAAPPAAAAAGSTAAATSSFDIGSFLQTSEMGIPVWAWALGAVGLLLVMGKGKF